MDSLFRAEGLVKKYRRRAVVNDISFDVNRGEVVGILGPNGAGKTTAFRMCIGLIKPVDGRVYFNDRDVTGEPMHRRARRGMGYLAQEPSLFQKLSVEDNLLAVMQMRGEGRKERHAKCNRLLQEFGLTRLRTNLALSLSGGERRRLEIARTLCSNPAIVLLDEPFTGIDPIAVGEIQGLVVQLKERGIGVLITDHNVLEALRITDRAYILSEGEIVTHGTSEQLVQDPIAREHYLGDRIQAHHIGIMDLPGVPGPAEAAPEETPEEVHAGKPAGEAEEE
jgi:lipopolysaccharide export system ATP-binding protein